MEDRRKVLEMLAAEKITMDEAEQLLDKISPSAASMPALIPGEGAHASGRVPKFLRVHVDDADSKVNVQVPLALLRTGIKLKAMMPDSTHEELKSRGIDLAQLSDLDVDELIIALADFRVDVSGEGGKELVQVWCE